MSKGALGHCPPTYDLIRAAKYLGVAPWDLARQHHAWLELARDYEAAEQKARAHFEKQDRAR